MLVVFKIKKYLSAYDLQSFKNKKNIFMIRRMLVLAAMLLTVHSTANSQPGTLDTSFGIDGRVTAAPSLDSRLFAASLQDDGKILIAGTGVDFNITRLLADGTVDKSFGENGVVGNYFFPYYQTIGGIQLLSDGKFITAGTGSHEDSSSYSNILLAKYLPDGTPDSSFGENGRIIHDFGLPEYRAHLQIQPDGKIVVMVTAVTNVQQNTQIIFTARFLADGSVDESFGNAGQALWDKFLPRGPGGTDLALQPNGKILVTARGSGEPSYLHMVRYNPDGSYDSSFARNGILELDLPESSNEFINALTVLKDGKILAAGMGDYVGAYRYGKMLVIRFNSDGAIDETFGSGGTTYIQFEKNYGEANGIVMQEDGKIIIAGQNQNHVVSPAIGDFGLARLSYDGIPDSSFGKNGLQTTDFGGFDYALVPLLQPDGKIICAGQREGNYTYALARYHGDPVATNPLITRINSWIQDNLLGWYSTNSSSVNYYSIQYSKNGSSFTEVKRVPAEKLSAAGREPSANAYRYMLAAAPTDSYYRIAAIQQDGSKAYSEVVYYPGNKGTVSLYPNPVKDVLTVTGLPQNKPTTIQLVNRNGHIISAEKIHTNTFTKNIHTLQSGVYYIRILTSGNMQTLQFVKE